MLVQHLIMAFRPYTTTCIAKNLIYCVNKVYTWDVAQNTERNELGIGEIASSLYQTVSAPRGIGMMSGGGKMPNMGTRMMADSADDVPVSTEEGVGGTRDTYPAPKKLSVQVERYSGRYRRVSRIHIFMAD